ncbi:hypothetical protein PFISCL1PPCAC_3051, partial [Pristionchus fissidentatus]
LRKMRLGLLLLLVLPLISAGIFDSISNFFSGGVKKIKEHFTPVSIDKAKDYLQTFGYVPPAGLSSGGGIKGAFEDAKSALRSAVKKFQEFAHLNPTGELDETTREKMAAPRCGEPDVQFITSGSSAFKWRKNDLTYSIDSWSPDLPKDQIRRAIAEAYGVWAAVTPLTFREVPAGQGDIKIKFGSGNHGDPWPFDGKGGVLAHATMPENGALHFDEDENWVYMDAKKIASSSYTDFFAVAIHEGGHTLGLSHSRDESSIMAPFYQKTVNDNGNYVRPTLKSADIRDIQDIYGRGTGSVRPDVSPPNTGNPNRGGFVDIPPISGGGRPTTTTTWRPPSSGGGGSIGSGGGGFVTCPVTVDGIGQLPDGTAYLFSGGKVFQVDTRSKKVKEQYTIIQMFPGGPPYVSGAVYNPINSIMLLFQGGQVWGFTFSKLRGRFQLDAEYPKRLPIDIGFVPTGAFRAPNGHQVLVGPSDQFAVYDEYWNQITLQNRMNAYFPNMPSGVKGALSPSGDFLIGFTITRAFEYNTRTRSTHPDQRLVRQYLGC